MRSHLTGSSTKHDLLPVGLDAPVPLLDVLGHVAPDDLQAGTLAVAPHAAALAALENVPANDKQLKQGQKVVAKDSKAFPWRTFRYTDTSKLG